MYIKKMRVGVVSSSLGRRVILSENGSQQEDQGRYVRSRLNRTGMREDGRWAARYGGCNTA